MLDLNLKETELCLGLPGGGNDSTPTRTSGGKRGFSETVVDLNLNFQSSKETTTHHLPLPTTHPVDLNRHTDDHQANNNHLIPHDPTPKDPTKPPAAKAQVVGWPPVRSYRKNVMAQKRSIEEAAAFVKVCMDGAPYLRKVDLKMYQSYHQLSDALAKMFSSFTMGNYGTQGMIDFMNERKLMDVLNSSDYVPTYEDKDGDWMLVGDVPWEMFVESCKRLRIMKGSEAIGLAPRAMEKCKSRT